MLSSDPLVIETHGLSKTYPSVQALKSLDLRVPRHSIFGFLGPNGAGKTTAIKLLLGLAAPTGGSGQVFGYDVQRDSVKIRQRVGYLAQDPRYFEYMSARETLRFTAKFFFHGPKRKIEERVEETLELVGLENKANRPIKGFSGGERQRLGIAQAQINYPDLLILDEPAASLDPQGRHDVLAVMERLRKYTTIFYSTHILEDVQRVSDTVAILNQGELIALAPIGELLSGSEKPVYRLETWGEIASVRASVAAQPWVSSVSIEEKAGCSHWQVAVDDDDCAGEELLRIVLADRGVRVLEYGRLKYDLEDVFLKIVGEGNHGKE